MEKIDEKFDTESNWSLDTSISNISLFENDDDDNINEKELDVMFEDIQKMAENQEKELENEINNIQINENFNKQLEINLDKAFKESFFEYRITGLVSINNDTQKTIYE